MPNDRFHASVSRLSAEADADLPKYFAPTASLAALADFASSRVLAVGLKGIGKTAAFRYFTEIDDAVDLVIAVNAHIYKLHLPQTDLNSSTCQAQFEHDLVIEALRVVSENRASIETRVGRPLVADATKQVKSYLKLLQQAAGRFRGISILGCGFTIGSPGPQVLVGLRRSDEVQESFAILRRICDAGIKIRVVVDDPELVFSAGQALDTNLVGGFFLAALSLSSKIENFKVLVLIKTHVYYPVDKKIEDIDKYPKLKVDLSWAREELAELISKRMQWANSTWTSVFDSSEKDARELVTSSMCDSIRNGPRDLLRWIDLAIEAAAAGKITKMHIESTRREMARYSLKSLERSFEASYPKVTTVIQEIFRRHPGKRYKLPELRTYIERLLPTDKAMQNMAANQTWMLEETYHTLPTVLFQVGSLALGLDDRQILPYERGYDAEHFEAADYVCLAPALIEAI